MDIDKELFQQVCFLALMQHGEGLISKSPKYIKEKMRVKKSPLAAWQMLDNDCQLVVLTWADRWNIPIMDFIRGL